MEIALVGSEYHCSKKIHCAHCATRRRGHAGTEYFHAMLAATLVAPGHDKVVPLEPEFIVPQDGAERVVEVLRIGPDLALIDDR